MKPEEYAPLLVKSECQKERRLTLGEKYGPVLEGTAQQQNGTAQQQQEEIHTAFEMMPGVS